MLATYKDNIELVKLLINAGADPNKKNNNGNTALSYAIKFSNIEIIKLLLDLVVDIDRQNDNGDTALILAAYKNDREKVELLLNYYADEFILNRFSISFYDYLNDGNKEYFLHKYPTSVYNAISHSYKKSFTEFVKDYNIKI
jgi:ankyrin repeat protein